jgi:hypothetical protein
VELRRFRDRDWFRPAILQPCANAIIGELGAIVHERPIDVGMGERAVFGDVHLDDDRETILAFVERGEVRR